MVEPTQDIGTIAFGLALVFMCFCAGVSSLPPARSYRVLIGALVLTVAWLIMLGIQTHYNDWDVSSNFFFLDIFYASIFFVLSRPSQKKETIDAHENDWAGHIVAIFVLMIIMQIIHFLSAQEFVMKPAVITICIALSFIFFLGFARGFGWRATTYLGVLFIIMTIGSLRYYVEAANALTFLVIVLITLKAGKRTIKNITHWLKLKKTA